MLVSRSICFMLWNVQIRPCWWARLVLGCLTIENLLLARHQPILDFNIQQILNWIGLKQRLILIVDNQTVLDATILNTWGAQRWIAPIISIALFVVMVLGAVRLRPHTLQGILSLLCLPRFLGLSLLAQLSFGTGCWCFALFVFRSFDLLILQRFLLWTENVELLAEGIGTSHYWTCSDPFQMLLCKIDFVLFQFYVLLPLVWFGHLCGYFNFFNLLIIQILIWFSWSLPQWWQLWLPESLCLVFWIWACRWLSRLKVEIGYFRWCLFQIVIPSWC